MVVSFAVTFKLISEKMMRCDADAATAEPVNMRPPP